jgi:hypothetical protein
LIGLGVVVVVVVFWLLVVGCWFWSVGLVGWFGLIGCSFVCLFGCLVCLFG